MSNMTSQTSSIEAQPFLQHKLRKIVFHPSQFTSNKLNKWNQEHQQRQHLFLINICKKYATYEQQQIREKSKEEMKSQMKHLRHHLKNSISKQSIQEIMGKNEQRKQNCLSNISKSKTELIDIGQKYHKKINLKLQLLNEADSIRNYKNQYKLWYNSNKNNAKDSPILHRMSYIIDKQKDKYFSQHSNKDSEKINIRKSLQDQPQRHCQAAYKRKKRNYDNNPSH